MFIDRNKVVRVYLLLLILCSCFFSFQAHAASRGVIIKARTYSGTTKEIQLYSGYHALVVACGDYRKGWPSLPNPVKDANEVASLLKNIGWTVDVLTNPNGATLRRELNKLVTGPGRNKEKAIFVWFSGHGQTIGEADGTKLGYLVPVDAPDPDKDLLGFLECAVSMRQIETVSKQIMSKHVLMVFDSCFSGAIFQMVRAKPSPYIQEKVSYPVRQFITAGTENEQVPDKSIFKDVFVQGVKDNFADLNRDSYITGEEIGAYLQEKVINYSRKTQHPQYGKINNPKLDKGDFVFAQIEIDELTLLKRENEELRQQLKELKAELSQRKNLIISKPISKQVDNQVATVSYQRRPLKVAIFPFLFRNKAFYLSEVFINEMVRSIDKSNIMARSDDFTIELSYYVLSQELNIKKIDENIDIKYMSPDNTKNLNTICELGEKLKVDTVLIANINVEGAFGLTIGNAILKTSSIFLIDVKSKKLFSAKNLFGNIDVMDEISRLMRKVIKDYKEHIFKYQG